MGITNQLQTKQELQSLGFLGIIKESIKLIGSRWRKLFLQISATFILPQTLMALFIYGSKTESINRHHQILLNQSTGANASPPPSVSYFDLTLSFTFLALSVVLSLSSVSVVAYTVACVYQGEDQEETNTTITFSKVIRIIPKTWKRLLGTYLAILLVLLVIEAVIILLFAITWVVFLGKTQMESVVVVVVVVVVVAFALLLCVAVIWFGVVTQLALVIATLEEEVYEFKALVKSKELMKGKVRVGTAIFLVGSSFGSASWFLYGKFAMSSVIGIVGYSLIITLLVLFQYVNGVVFYFVCKSYHREAVEKNKLKDLIEVSNRGGYVPVSFVKDTQLEQV